MENQAQIGMQFVLMFFRICVNVFSLVYQFIVKLVSVA